MISMLRRNNRGGQLPSNPTCKLPESILPLTVANRTERPLVCNTRKSFTHFGVSSGMLVHPYWECSHTGITRGEALRNEYFVIIPPPRQKNYI